MFLDASYFRGDLYLPSIHFRERTVGMSVADQVTGEQDLCYYIRKYEVDFLEKLLGRCTAHAFIKGMEEGDEQWKELYEIIYYTEFGYKLSPAANYVYFHLMRNNSLQNSQFGLIRQKSDHSDVVSITPKMVLVWNDMVRQNLRIAEKLCGCKCSHWWWWVSRPVPAMRRHCHYGHPHGELFLPINSFGI